MINKIKDLDLNQSLVGIFWMVITTILFVGVTATVRYLEGEVPAPQAAFLRYAIGTILLIPSLISLTKFRPHRPLMKKFILRGFVHSIGVTLWFYAMSVMPVAEVTAIGFLTYIFVFFVPFCGHINVDSLVKSQNSRIPLPYLTYGITSRS